jgi:hypothetical protein
LKLGVDDPNEEKAFFLQHRDGNLLDGLIAETAILNGDSSRRLRTGESPRRVHHDHIKLPLGYLQLLFDETLEVKLGDVSADRYRIVSHKGF